MALAVVVRGSMVFMDADFNTFYEAPRLIATISSDKAIPIQSAAGWPAVICSSCGVHMRPTDKRRITPSFDMVVVRYYCEQCRFETFRTAKDD
jgi:hypothetical protein